MVEAGHEVHMITSHNGPKYIKEVQDGVQVHYLPVTYKSSFHFFRRVIAFLLFSHHAYYLCKKIKSPDLIYATSTPLTVGLVALKLKQKFHLPYVFEVRDLWPEVPIQMKIIRNPFFKFIARYLEKKTYAGASRIIVLSPGIEQSVTNLSYVKSVHLCPNMSDCDFFEMGQGSENILVEKYALKGKFVISYFGAIGPSNALDYLLDVALIAQMEGWEIAFFILGEGPMKKDLIKRKESEGLENVYFIDHQNKRDLKKYLSITDAAYISFANFSVFEMNSPNKFFDALASGKLIISNVNGWIRGLIETHSCGFYYHPEQPELLFRNLKSFLEDPGKLETYQKNARKLAVTHFNRKTLIRQLFDYLEIR
jgi:glycosyltransferase involved in cell wall biosynthesis